MSKIVNKWNYEKHMYEPHAIPDEWNATCYEEDMCAEINCARCGKKIKFGDGYTSRTIHTRGGMGYSVCECCNAAERAEERSHMK